MRRVLSIILLLLACGACDASVQYTVTQIALPAGFTPDFDPTSQLGQGAIGISDDGQIAINATSASVLHGLLYNQGTFTDLAFGGSSGSSISAISSGGIVAGFTQGHGIMLNQGQVTNLGLLRPTGVNNSGLVVGGMGDGHIYSYQNGVTTDLGSVWTSTDSIVGVDGAGQIYAAVAMPKIIGVQGLLVYHLEKYSNGAWTDLTPTSSSPFTLNAVTDSGGLAGSFMGITSNSGFFYDGQSFHSIKPPNYLETFSSNDAGQVVGFFYTNGVKLHAFVTSNGTLQDLNSLIDPSSNWMLMQATGINTSGQIVGDGIGPDGQTDVFLLNPVPEPTGVGAIIVAAAFGLLRRRDQHAS